MRCARCGLHKRRVGPCSNCGARGGPYVLSDMEFDEISFCESGINQKAHVVLVKSDNPLDQLDATIQHLQARLGIPHKVPIFKAKQPTFTYPEQAMDIATKSETPEQASVDSLATLAKSLQSQQPHLTKEQAFAAVLDSHPELYDPNGRPPRPVAKQVDLELSPQVDGLAIMLQKADPSLSREQAVLKALTAEPTWYDEQEVS